MKKLCLLATLSLVAFNAFAATDINSIGQAALQGIRHHHQDNEYSNSAIFNYSGKDFSKTQIAANQSPSEVLG